MKYTGTLFLFLVLSSPISVCCSSLPTLFQPLTGEDPLPFSFGTFDPVTSTSVKTFRFPVEQFPYEYPDFAYDATRSLLAYAALDDLQVWDMTAGNERLLGRNNMTQLNSPEANQDSVVTFHGQSVYVAGYYGTKNLLAVYPLDDLDRGVASAVYSFQLPERFAFEVPGFTDMFIDDEGLLWTTLYEYSFHLAVFSLDKDGVGRLIPSQNYADMGDDAFSLTRIPADSLPARPSNPPLVLSYGRQYVQLYDPTDIQGSVFLQQIYWGSVCTGFGRGNRRAEIAVDWEYGRAYWTGSCTNGDNVDVVVISQTNFSSKSFDYVDSFQNSSYNDVYQWFDNIPAVPITDAPTSLSPTSPMPTTLEPTTDSPTTNVPTTAAPTTISPTTTAPTTVSPTTTAPTSNTTTVGTAAPTKKPPKTGEIVGTVLGSLLGVVLIMMVVYCLVKRKRSPRREYQPIDSNEPISIGVN